MLTDASREGMTYGAMILAVVCVSLAVREPVADYSSLMQKLVVAMLFLFSPAIVCAGIIATDIERARAALLFSAGLPKSAFVLAKFMNGFVLTSLSCIPPMLVALVLNEEFSKATLGKALWICFSLILSLAAAVAFLTLLSAVLPGTKNSFYQLVIAITSFAILLKINLENSDFREAHPVALRVLKLILFSPYPISSATASRGMPTQGDIVTVVATIVISLGLAILLVRRKELGTAMTTD